MAKAAKPKKKKDKYDIFVKTNLTGDELLDLGLNTPIKGSNVLKKRLKIPEKTPD